VARGNDFVNDASDLAPSKALKKTIFHELSFVDTQTKICRKSSHDQLSQKISELQLPICQQAMACTSFGGKT
jgi:hypothetical protein